MKELTKQQQIDYMVKKSRNDELNENMKNNFIELITLNEITITNYLELEEVLQDLLNDLLNEFYDLLDDDWGLYFDDFIQDKLKDKKILYFDYYLQLKDKGDKTK